jgi:adenine phosphoribosyltransferase
MENQIKTEEIHQEVIDSIKDAVSKIPDFPKPGILFYDLFSILKSVDLTQKTFDIASKLIKNFILNGNHEVTAIVGLESRGFLLGLVLADRLRLPFVPVRKKNKLPGTILKVNYVTEYSQDTLELQQDALDVNSKVLIVDDLIATGGSMRAAEDLVGMVNGTVVGYFVLFEIEKIYGKNKLTKPDGLISMIKI